MVATLWKRQTSGNLNLFLLSLLTLRSKHRFSQVFIILVFYLFPFDIQISFLTTLTQPNLILILILTQPWNNSMIIFCNLKFFTRPRLGSSPFGFFKIFVDYRFHIVIFSRFAEIYSMIVGCLFTFIMLFLFRIASFVFLMRSWHTKIVGMGLLGLLKYFSRKKPIWLFQFWCRKLLLRFRIRLLLFLVWW